MDTGSLKIIYILGGGHSGSTLLDLILGSTDRAFSVGELGYIDFYKGFKTEKAYRLVDGRICTCGEHFDNCPFWSNIVFDQKDNVAKHESLAESFRILVNILNPFERWIKARFRVGPNLDVYDRIFKQARKIKPNTQYIVDSSKDPRRLYELIQDADIGPDKLAVIHLVRDGRGYIYSYQKAERLKGGRDLRGTVECLLEWISVNFLARRLIRKYDLNAFKLSYDRFAENPEKFLEMLGKFLDLDISTDLVLKQIQNTVYHNVHGNPIRRGQITEIRRDTAWMDFFPPVKRFLLGAVLYPFNRRWVYYRD